MGTLYDELAIEKTASPDAIKKAYRLAAQRNHPDKGGDREKFQRIQQAYDVLGDPEKRREYDAHGTTNFNRPTLRDKAIVVIVQLFDQEVSQMRDDYLPFTNLIKNVRLELGAQRRQFKDGNNNGLKLLRRLRKIGRRMKYSGSLPNDPLRYHLDARRKEIITGMLGNRENRRVVAEAESMLDDYEYEVDVVPMMSGLGGQPPNTTGGGSWFTLQL